MTSPRHNVSIVVEGQQIQQALEYDIATSLIEPAATFTITFPWHKERWRALRRDARVRVLIDTTKVLDGFIDERKRHSRDSTITVSGRGRSGRLVQESAARVNYNGLDITQAAALLVAPWFPPPTLSDARNRRLMLGKGYRQSSGTEPVLVHKVVERGRAHAGQSRWSVLEEIASAAGYMLWASADGTEIFLGEPNQTQPSVFHVTLAAVGSGTKTTVKELDYEESNGDRFSVIGVVGAGGGTDADYGSAAASRRGVVRDDPTNDDGTGRDFLYPKRLLMPEHHFESNNDASAVAAREQARRDFRRTMAIATMPFHGQLLDGVQPTIFAVNTMARVIDEELELDDDFLIFAVTHRGRHSSGAESVLEMVPRGTKVVQ